MKTYPTRNSGAHRARNEVNRANVEETLRAIEAIQNNDQDRATSAARSLAAASDHDREDLCDSHILAIAAAQCGYLAKVAAGAPNLPLPPQIPHDLLQAAYETRETFGSLITVAINHVRKHRDEAPIPMAYQDTHMRWDTFGTSWPITSSEDVAGAWALDLVTSGRYAEAAAVLDESDAYDRHLPQAARLALYLETQRWSDLIDAVQHTVGDQNLADPHLHGIAQACLGLAMASLDNAEPAIAALKKAEDSDNPTVAAWALLRHGLYLRTQGDSSQASKLISASMVANYSPQAEAAINDPDRKLRTTTRALVLTRTDKWDVDTEDDPEAARKRDVASKREAYREEAEALLGRKVGMETIKAKLRSAANLMTVNQEKERRGLATKPFNYNRRFEGPPGTGKTTIIEAFTLYLASAGVIDDPVPMIISAEDLTSENIGGTSSKTKELILSAKGRLVDIDEVYALLPDESDSTGANSAGIDVINTLVNLMDQLIGTTVFVFTGYPHKMERVMRTNPGLERRLPSSNTIRFSTFSQAQFSAVAKVEAEEAGYIITDDVLDYLADENGPARKVKELNHDATKTIMDDLGNGGFARNLIEEAAERQANRIVDDGLNTMDQDYLRTLTFDDVIPAFEQFVNASMHGSQIND